MKWWWSKPVAFSLETESVACGKCGVLVKRCYAKAVTARNYGTAMFYCQAHAPNYDQIGAPFNGERTFYRMFRVSEDGTPIGYVPAKKGKK